MLSSEPHDLVPTIESTVLPSPTHEWAESTNDILDHDARPASDSVERLPGTSSITVDTGETEDAAPTGVQRAITSVAQSAKAYLPESVTAYFSAENGSTRPSLATDESFWSTSSIQAQSGSMPPSPNSSGLGILQRTGTDTSIAVQTGHTTPSTQEGSIFGHTSHSSPPRIPLPASDASLDRSVLTHTDTDVSARATTGHSIPSPSITSLDGDSYPLSAQLLDTPSREETNLSTTATIGHAKEIVPPAVLPSKVTGNMISAPTQPLVQSPGMLSPSTSFTSGYATSTASTSGYLASSESLDTTTATGTGYFSPASGYAASIESGVGALSIDTYASHHTPPADVYASEESEESEESLPVPAVPAAFSHDSGPVPLPSSSAFRSPTASYAYDAYEPQPTPQSPLAYSSTSINTSSTPQLSGPYTSSSFASPSTLDGSPSPIVSDPVTTSSDAQSSGGSSTDDEMAEQKTPRRSRFGRLKEKMHVGHIL